MKENRGLSLGLCKFEMPEVGLSGQLEANIWIQTRTNLGI